MAVCSQSIVGGLEHEDDLEYIAAKIMSEREWSSLRLCF